MSGPEVRFTGEQLDAFIGSLSQLAAEGPVVVGGLAVMCRLGGAHRVTLDVDSTFDRPDDPPTIVRLVDAGVASRGDSPQRVVVGGAVVDVIDTFAIDEPDLPDDPKDRLFVCAHRYAWETGEQVTFRGDTNTAHLRVATIDALIAMKAHALRFGSRQRRQQKRSSDLHDLLLLAERADTQILAGAPWQLAHQVRDALTEDLSDPATAAATLRAAGTPAADRFSADVVDAVTRRLLARLR